MSVSFAPNRTVAKRVDIGARRGDAASKWRTPGRTALLAAVLPALFACNVAMAQVEDTVEPTPTIGATSPLGIGMGSVSSPTGIPLGSTEIRSGGVSPGPSGLAGTITIPTTSSGTACSTGPTSPAQMFGSAAMYDGGGTTAGASAPATAVDPGTIPIPGVSTPSNAGTSTSPGMSTSSGMLDTSGLSGMCGSGSGSMAASSSPTSTSPTTPGGAARTGLPFGSYEIGNLGVSSTPAVPLPSALPIAGTPALGPSMPTMPTVSPTMGSATTSPPIGSLAACVPGANPATSGAPLKVAGAGSAGINLRGATIPEIMQRQFILCQRSQ
jgi:hypothetical protein